MWNALVPDCHRPFGSVARIAGSPAGHGSLCQPGAGRGRPAIIRKAESFRRAGDGIFERWGPTARAVYRHQSVSGGASRWLCRRTRQRGRAILTKLGFDHTIMLTDDHATRSAILEALTGLLRMSRAGDTVVLQYAGTRHAGG